MGKVFKLMNRLEVTDSLYTQVTKMWYNYLRRLLQTRVVFTDMDAVLGKKDDENDENDENVNKENKLGKKWIKTLIEYEISVCRFINRS